MNEVFVCINKKLSLKIFEESVIKRKVDYIFSSMDENIKQRYNVIKSVSDKKDIREISYTTILTFFKLNFLKKVLNDAIVYLCNKTSNDSFKKAVLYCITEDSLKESIFGEEMINAFEKAITELPGPATFIRGAEIVLIREKFLKFNPYSRELKKYNHCSECGCDCKCNADCEGDTTKCTSPYAKNCNHHCDCWIFPLAEKRRQEEGSRVISTKKSN